MSITSIRNTLLTRTLSILLLVRAKLLLHVVWSYDFYDITLYVKIYILGVFNNNIGPCNVSDIKINYGSLQTDWKSSTS